ncbi:MAG: hypothetical protein CMF69_12660 [Magnetovibrio sp.]|nr:hypothetical protein [Magnetovibrio sp.]
MIIVSDLEQAMTALATASFCNRPVTLRSPESTSAAIGPAIFAETIKLALANHPKGFAGAVFDCGSQTGLAIAAIRNGHCDIIIDMERGTSEKIKKLAKACNITAVDKAALNDLTSAVLDLKRATNVSLIVKDFLENTHL